MIHLCTAFHPLNRTAWKLFCNLTDVTFFVSVGTETNRSEPYVSCALLIEMEECDQEVAIVVCS